MLLRLPGLEEPVPAAGRLKNGGESMDIKLFYEERGEGEALILLHGNGEHGGYFVHQMEYFSRKYRVIAVDTRGHGLSPRGKGAFSLERFAEDLRQFMDEKEIAWANILGFSDGGNIGLIFALKYPERVKNLILNGANLHPDGVKRKVQIPIVLEYRKTLRFAKKSKKARRKAELLGLMVNEPDISEKELSGLPVRTLVIAGKRDMIRESHTKKIYQSLPNAKLALIEGDHFIAKKNPEVFNRVTDAFLENGKHRS